MTRTIALVGAIALLASCHKSRSPEVIVDPPDPGIQLGDPLPDLTAEELASFERGKVLFSKRFKPSDGLGPLYNATSCESCHSKPVMGGSAELYRNFFIVTFGQVGSPTALPGLPSPVIPAFGGDSTLLPFNLERGRKVIPNFPGLVHTTQRNSIPIFGTGLFEFISNATILANADPNDDDGDGISGRTNADGAGMGRFGVKSQSNNIEFFTRAPLQNQLGITTNPFRGLAGTINMEHGMAVQVSSNPNLPTTDDDGVQDPEMSAAELGDLIAFSRFLAPPQPLEFNDAARRGEALFDSIGCAKCHIPELQSSRGPVRAYTDLLIHDMGDALAEPTGFGTPQLSSNPAEVHTGREFRSQPLWGVRHFAPYLHDGRANSLDEAIRWHGVPDNNLANPNGGEAQAIREAYEALPATDREDILEFLRHL